MRIELKGRTNDVDYVDVTVYADSKVSGAMTRADLTALRDQCENLLSYKFAIWCPMCKEAQGDELFVIGRKIEQVCPNCELTYVKTFTEKDGPRASMKG